MDDGGILPWHLAAERLGAPGGGNAAGGEEVLGSVRDAVEGPAISAGLDLGIRRIGLPAGQFVRQRDDALELWIEPCEAVEIDLGQLTRGESPRFDQAGQFANGEKGDVGGVGRAGGRTGCRGADFPGSGSAQ